MSLEAFQNRFRFRPELAGFVGVEREAFLADADGNIVPRAAQVLCGLNSRAFGYELSACQVETRVGPKLLARLGEHLTGREAQLSAALQRHGLNARHTEVGPANMPLEVYPDPTGRYERMTKDMPPSILLAACRVIGTHVHIGMPDHESALAVYNSVCRHWRDLCDLGNGSFGERLAIYKQMAPNYEPRPFKSWQHYYETACAQGFAEDPRKCWSLIRVSAHGTVEFRMFGATDSIPRIVSWAQRSHELCYEALAKN